MKEAWLRFLHYFGLGPRDWIILVGVDSPTPSETVTAWNAYEAAPQRASSAKAAITSFVRDRQIGGRFVAVPYDEWVVLKEGLEGGGPAANGIG